MPALRFELEPAADRRPARDRVRKLVTPYSRRERLWIEVVHPYCTTANTGIFFGLRAYFYLNF